MAISDYFSNGTQDQTQYATKLIQVPGTNYGYAYKYNSDGTIGVDYFDSSGRPVTNTEFSSATGKDSKEIENRFSTLVGPIDPNFNPYKTYRNVANSQDGTTGEPFLYNGVWYDPNNQDSMRNYFSVANTDAVNTINKNYDETISGVDRSSSNLEYNKNKTIEELRKQRDDIRKEKENWFSELAKQGKTFKEGKDIGDVSRSQYYTGRGANAFQSSQAYSQDYADDKFAEGTKSLVKAGNDATNEYGYLEGQYGNFNYDPNDPTQYNGFEDFGTVGMDYGRQWEQDAADLAKARESAATTRDISLNRAKDELLTGIYDIGTQSAKDFSTKYKVTPYAGTSTAKPDLSGFQVFTNFTGKAPTSGSVTSGAKFTNPNDILEGSQKYLGYTPTGAVKKKLSKDPYSTDQENYFGY